MKVELKYFSKAERLTYICINIVMIVAMLVMLLLANFIPELSLANIFGAIGLVLFIVLAVMNGILVVIINTSISKISKAMIEFLKQENYRKGIEYFSKFSLKKRLFIPNQIITYYLGYLELMQENIDNAKTYFEQMEFIKYHRTTVYCASISMSLLYIIYMQNGEAELANKLKQVYLTEKDSIIRLTQKDSDLAMLLKVLDNSDKESYLAAIKELNGTRFSKLPLIKNI